MAKTESHEPAFKGLFALLLITGVVLFLMGIGDSFDQPGRNRVFFSFISGYGMMGFLLMISGIAYVSKYKWGWHLMVAFPPFWIVYKGVKIYEKLPYEITDFFSRGLPPMWVILPSGILLGFLFHQSSREFFRVTVKQGIEWLLYSFGFAALFFILINFSSLHQSQQEFKCEKEKPKQLSVIKDYAVSENLNLKYYLGDQYLYNQFSVHPYSRSTEGFELINYYGNSNFEASEGWENSNSSFNISLHVDCAFLYGKKPVMEKIQAIRKEFYPAGEKEKKEVISSKYKSLDPVFINYSLDEVLYLSSYQESEVSLQGYEWSLVQIDVFSPEFEKKQSLEEAFESHYYAVTLINDKLVTLHVSGPKKLEFGNLLMWMDGKDIMPFKAKNSP